MNTFCFIKHLVNSFYKIQLKRTYQLQYILIFWHHTKFKKITAAGAK